MIKLYPKWKEALIAGEAGAALVGVVRAALIDRAAYAYSDAHQFFTSLAGAVVGAPQDLLGLSYANGVFAAGPVTNFPHVTGPTVGAIVIYLWTGTAATSRLVYYTDEAAGLPIVPNGGDATVTWDSAGIFQL
jgi:hypothetical protein